MLPGLKGMYSIAYFIITFHSISLAQSPAVAPSPISADYYLVELALDYLNHDIYDSVFAIGARLRERYPEHPIGYFVAMDAYHTFMRDYRVQKYIAEFDSLLPITLAKAKQTLATYPTAENYFLLGATVGHRSMHLFSTGKWFKAVKLAFKSVNLFKKANELDSTFVDPLLGIALFEYVKSKVLFGILGGSREESIRKLERVRKEGYFVSVNAAYSLQRIYFEQSNFQDALEINEWLYERYPSSPTCLYNRALLLETQGHFPDALIIWRRLISRIEESAQPSQGFLAECYYRLAKIYHLQNDIETSWKELIRAAKHAHRYRLEEEIKGPYASFKETKKDINRALSSWQH